MGKLKHPPSILEKAKASALNCSRLSSAIAMAFRDAGAWIQHWPSAILSFFTKPRHLLCQPVHPLSKLAKVKHELITMHRIRNSVQLSCALGTAVGSMLLMTTVVLSLGSMRARAGRCFCCGKYGVGVVIPDWCPGR
mmetsp:Transcript_100832/g.178985  ORF Transcript_100832/g.178985 Transcript_100832/m.178985 type:complete len:137 (+) Transcript_100832:130-540(+)